MVAKHEASENEENNEVSKEKLKTCFIIMPIADHPDYEKGHFNRVYDYLIKPACVRAGYQPIRADDSKASHMIMFDILKKIMECDMAICDLSSKNANVFYELGLRQAFNKKTILITDGRDKAPFDISGFRYVPYTPTLRVDSVEREILSIGEMLKETESAPEDDVNSIVKLLKIRPAHVEPVELNQSESMIFSMFSKLEDKLDSLLPRQTNWEAGITDSIRRFGLKDSSIITEDISRPKSLLEILKSGVGVQDSERFINGDEYLGALINVDEKILTFENKHSNEIKTIPYTHENVRKITTMRKRKPRTT
jgi:hypothetical protein